MEALVGAALLSGTAGASAVGLVGAGGVFAPAAGSIAGALGSIGGMSLLSGVMTAASAFGQIQSANMQAASLNMQARQADIQARNELLRGRQTSLAIRQQLERDLAGASATFAARGVLAGEGSAQAALDKSRADATEDINIAMYGAKMGAESEMMQGQQYRMEAKASKTLGYTRAATSLLEGV